MNCVEIYIRILAYTSIVIVSLQSVFNVISIEKKIGIDYFLHIAVEICYWYMSVSFMIVIRKWKYPELKRELKDTTFKQEKYPTIDILIPCYNEDEHLIYNTILEATKIDYPKNLYNIFLLDDSKRDSLKKICSDLNVAYIRRSINNFQKPGNINNLLKMQQSLNIFADTENQQMLLHHNNIINYDDRIDNNELSQQTPPFELIDIENYMDDYINNEHQCLNSNSNNSNKNRNSNSNSNSNSKNNNGSCNNNSSCNNNGNNNGNSSCNNNNNNNNNNNSDYICVLDCDMIPKHNIFQVLIPYLLKNEEITIDTTELVIDHTVAFVQPRQYFYNCNYKDDYYDMDSSIYVKLTMPAMNEIGNTPYIGTNALISRNALNDVGLFFEGHATEDTITSLLLCSADKKYISKYVYPQKVAEGFAPETLAEAFDQRLRWVKGSVQLIMNKNPILRSNLNIQQKIAWTSTNLYWIFGIFFFIQYASHIYVLIYLAFENIDSPIQDVVIYQFSFITQLISFMLLPEITFVEKIRSMQMFTSYIPVYIFAFLSHIFGCLSISIVSNKGVQRKFHILFVFHIVILVSIYGLCIYNMIAKNLNGWEYAKLSTLIFTYTFFFFPIVRTLFGILIDCCRKTNNTDDEKLDNNFIVEV